MSSFHSGTFSKLPAILGESFPHHCLRGGSDPAYILLADGTEYLDTVMGLGALIRGYDPAVAEVVSELVRTCRSGTFSLSQKLLPRVASLVLRCLRLPEEWVVHPVRTGSDGCIGAAMVARAWRPGRVAVFEGNYHGQHLQWKAPARGSLLNLEEIVEVPWEGPYPSPERLSCVIWELPTHLVPESARNWLHTCKASGVLIVADEVVTALRFPENRALLDPEPDIVVAGKALANGFGFYALLLPPELGQLLEPPDPVFLSTTYAADLPALAGVQANLFLDGDRLGKTVTGLGERLWDLLDPRFFDLESPLCIVGQPSRFVFRAEKRVLLGFREACFERKVYVNRPFCLSLAHEKHLRHLANVLNEALDEVLRGREPKGTLPLDIFSEGVVQR